MNGQQHILETDVLIIGAGPAGAACAIQLSRAGLKVIIIDKTSFPRHAPGETLHPGIEPLLEKLEVKERVLENATVRHDGIISIGTDDSLFTPYSNEESWQGFQFLRKEFDQLLIEEAVRLGARLLTDCKPRSIRRNDEGGIGDVVTSNGTIRPRHVIDASGRQAWLANQMDIDIELYSPKLITYYGYVESTDTDKLDNPKFYWDQCGWTWIAKIKEGIVSWVRLDVVKHEKKERCWVPRQLATHKSLGARRAADVTWRIVKLAADKNFFFVGDAAFVLDPASSHGVMKALMSGMMAAHLIISSNSTELKSIHKYYNKWIEQWFLNDHNELLTSYDSHLVLDGSNWLEGTARS